MKKLLFILSLGIILFATSCKQEVSIRNNYCDVEDLIIAQNVDSSAFQKCIVLNDRIIILGQASSAKYKIINGRVEVLNIVSQPIVVRNYNIGASVMLTIGLITLFVLFLVGINISLD